MTPSELYDELAETCDQVWVFTRPDNAEGEREDAVGALLQTLDDGMLAVTATITGDGLATITARAFDADGEQIECGVLHLGKSVMITA